MPMYVYQVKVELHAGDAPLLPDGALDMSRETIIYKCQRKATKFAIKTIESWCSNDRYEVWSPDPQTWCVDSLLSNARCTIRIVECKVRT